MTEQEQALAWLREQMGEGWKCSVYDAQTATLGLWDAKASLGSVTASGRAMTPMAAARACAEAWREATSDAARLAALGASGVARHASKRADEAEAELRAEREHADRLAEALRRIGSMEAFGVGGVADKSNPLWPEVDGRINLARSALAAHDARRAGEGR